ncbi:Uncharacterised protein [Campylobacter hyointestinalis]|uniref:Uncharacterized protein n=1 Tax=Campylobacter hyointestinalis subsp. hyointestinalis TaxID=91352 RepID=A0A0S4T382_CAMHY|nr:hypothetical protein [Campylobacter hyointestinalis]CUU88449.1 Uncharacterised protein [Campylobacter hyointestinalis subsp. hyointestinalis]CUU88748.1 Uncharacterised protein [Campylobacter hyointestinalis subsp. hyointestinalis]CUU90446.1 Uncharacterised protein [Campylobacter hyointestinalis subsp. hyointestinalis]CUU92375.1 Uncharacterised protein [Campylobacter hyointestinalis subsp. hyointestinalis]CUU92409.1 Uncharacterised protein [Campylobacter hyointestinalis]
MFSFIIMVLVFALIKFYCHFDFSYSKPYTGKTDTRYKDIKL